MKAYRIHEFAGLNSWRLDDVPEPSPGPGQVLVRIRAASLNFRDLLVAKGLYSKTLPFPMVPLSDGTGEVVEVGQGVTRVKPGDRVAASFMQTWIDGPVNDVVSRSALGGAVDGVLAEYAAFHENGLVKIPDHLSFEEAATLPCAGVTAWNALMTSVPITPGATVLLLGTGGVSLFALQFARLAGARVIATSGSDAKLARAQELGASDGINYKTTPDWDKRARELTGGLGVDHVVEVGGAGTLARSLRATRTSGQISLIGVLAGGAGDVPFFPVLMRSLRIQGIYVGSRAMFEAMNRAITQHRLQPIVDKVFAFDDAHAALAYLESGQHFGKVVIRV